MDDFSNIDRKCTFINFIAFHQVVLLKKEKIQSGQWISVCKCSMNHDMVNDDEGLGHFATTRTIITTTHKIK